MPQRLSFESLELLAGLHHKGRVRAGICHHPDDVPSAMPLAGIFGRASAALRQRHPVSGPLRRA